MAGGMNYGERLRHERDRRGWSQRFVGEQLGVHENSIKYQENRKARPGRTSSVAIALEELYNLTAESYGPVSDHWTEVALRSASDDELLRELRMRLAARPPATASDDEEYTEFRASGFKFKTDSNHEGDSQA